MSDHPCVQCIFYDRTRPPVKGKHLCIKRSRARREAGLSSLYVGPMETCPAWQARLVKGYCSA